MAQEGRKRTFQAHRADGRFAPMTADPGSEAVLESRRNTGEALLAATRESLPFLLRGRLRRRPEQFFDPHGRKRFAEEVALHLVAMDAAQKRRLRVGFDAFRDDPQV